MHGLGRKTSGIANLTMLSIGVGLLLAVLSADIVFACDHSDPRCIPSPRYQNGGSVPAGGGYRGGGGSTYSGGGGGRATAALGAASFGIGVLSLMIEAAEAQERSGQGARDNQARKRFAYCQANQQTAHVANERAMKLLAASNPEDAIGHIERAIDFLSRCGNRRDMVILKQNLENAQSDLLGSSTPSASKQVTSGGVQTRKLPPQLYQEAKALCGHAPVDSSDWQACMQRKQAEAVMLSDVEIRNACQSLTDIDEQRLCVQRRYMARLPDAAGGETLNCYWHKNGRPCYGSGQAARPAQAGQASLRDEMRTKLDALPDKESEVGAARRAEIANAEKVRDALPPGPDRDRLTAVIEDARAGRIPGGASPQPANSTAESPMKGEQSGTQDAVAAAAPAAGEGKSLNDQAYENYMQGRDGKLDNANNVDVGTPRSGSWAKDFGGDDLAPPQPQPVEDRTLFDQARDQHRNQQQQGNVGNR